jgi:glutathione S-transferase
MSTMADVILHHYWMSPFAEKARAALGFKKMSWRSVIIPPVMPKPDLMPLTGGYRKTPVLQIGADIYCDTALILRVLDRVQPSPSLFPSGTGGVAEMAAWWADRTLTPASFPAIFAENGDKLPDAFKADRAAFSGTSFDTDKMKALQPLLEDAFALHLTWLERALADGRPFLLGAQPCYADFAAYTGLWFAKGKAGVPRLLEPFPRVSAYAQRIAAFGKGEAVEMTGAEALAVAKAAEPAAIERTGSLNGLTPGARVTLAADDSGRDPVAGELVAVTMDSITIARDDDQVGRTHLHTPRAGFILRRDRS